jgi:hypothetical protein
MARDAIARQFDVDKNSVKLVRSTEPHKGGYHPGTITFQAKDGKSIDLEKVRESISATRLSGGTNMRMDWLEITARGEVAAKDKELILKVSGTGQEFVLAEDPGAKDALAKLRDAVAKGTPIGSVTGHVQGWAGRFPDVLRTVEPATSGKKPITLLVTDFAGVKK